MKSVGKGTVEARRKGVWRLRVSVVYDDGTPERLSKNVECRTKTEAKKLLDAWRAELLTNTVDIRRTGLTLAEFLNEHIEYCRDVENLSPNTVRGYRDIVNTRFDGAIGNTPLVDLKPFMIEEHMAYLRKQGGHNGRPLSGTSVQRAFSFLKTALKRAVMLEYIPTNPCERVKPPKRNKTEANFLTKEEVQQIMFLLIGHPSPQFAMACRLALATGMRRGELCGLRWQDVDFDEQRIHVAHSLAEVKIDDDSNQKSLLLKDCKTDSSERWIALDNMTAQWLKLHEAQQYYRLAYNGVEQTGDTPVCANDLGEWYRPSCCTSDFVAFRNQHGFDVRLHDTRHTQASLLIAAGEDIVTVSKRLGHSKVSTTLDIYSHLMPGKDRSAADKIGEIFAVPKVV